MRINEARVSVTRSGATKEYRVGEDGVTKIDTPNHGEGDWLIITFENDKYRTIPHHMIISVDWEDDEEIGF
jgi:hypothetical protein